MPISHIVPKAPSDEFTHSLFRLRETLKECGRIYHSPFRTPEIMSAGQEAAATKEINQWCTVMERFLRDGGSPTRTKDLFRYYLSLMGLNMDSFFLDAIKDGDVVEIFRGDATRMFFNPELFDFSSYTPEEMFTIPCPDLYHRDPAISELIYLQGYGILSGEIKTSVDPRVPSHVVSETRSERKYSCEIDLKLLGPVRLGHGVVAVAALESFKLLLT